MPGVNSVGDLTPFQNQVLDAAEKKEAEEERKQQEGGSSRSRTTNSRNPSTGSPNSGMSQKETVRYINESEN